MVSLFAANGRVTVLDLGVEPGLTNRFGCASAPQAFVRALGGFYDVRVAPYAHAWTAGAFDTNRTDLLVVPSGALFPNDCAGDLVNFLRHGGLLLTCGGYAFDEPMQLENGKWVLPASRPVPPAVCDRPLTLPPAAKWKWQADTASKMEVDDAVAPDGRSAIRIHSPHLRRHCLARVPFPCGDDSTVREALAFRVKGGPNLKSLRVEVNEQDGTRWWADVPVNQEWRDVSLAWTDFVFHADSPTAKTRGKAGDRINFSRAAVFVVGLVHIGNPTLCPQTAWIADLRVGADPLASRRQRVEARARINTRHYGPGWRDTPRPDQLGLFSPAYAFSGVSSIVNDDLSVGLYPSTRLTGDFAGWDASVMLTPHINGHAKNRAVLRPVLACRDKDGRLVGRAASVAFHYDSTFKGSAWAIFGVTSEDLFATSANDELVRTVTDALFQRVFLARTRPKFDCYRPGETMAFSTEVMDFSPKACAGSVRFTVYDEKGTSTFTTERPTSVRRGQSDVVSFAWCVPKKADDLYRIVAELVVDGKVIDREENAIAVWNEQTIAAGPKLGVDGTYFTIDGRKCFWIGAQAFVARQIAYTSASALRLYRDFRAMKESGLRISRNFFGWTPGGMTDPQERERVLRLMDACVLLSQKFGIVNYFNPVCGNEIPRTLDGVGAEARDVEMFARRYRDVPGFLMDVRNEARLACVNRASGQEPMSDQALAEAFVTWSRALADAAERGRAGISVATGWSQGWGWGTAYKDPPTAALPFSFTDCHYYGENARHLSEIKKIDQRITGRPAVMGECGVAFNPERVQYSDSFATEEEAARRYRCQAIQTFGSGYAFMCNYGWTDHIEGNLTFAFCHWDGNPRDVLKVYSKLARALSSFEVGETVPEVVLVLSDSRLVRGGLKPVTDVFRRAVDALSWWGCNYSVLPACARASIPAGTRLVLETDQLAAAGFDSPTDEDLKINPRQYLGECLSKAGVGLARQVGDTENLGVFRIPTKTGGVAWAFWNSDRTSSVRVTRGGQEMMIAPSRAALMRFDASGNLVNKEEL